MGGSSLGPEVIRRSYGDVPGRAAAARARLDRPRRRAAPSSARWTSTRRSSSSPRSPAARSRRCRTCATSTSAPAATARASCAVTDPGSPLVDDGERARLPARVRERPGHRRPLLGALLLRPRAGGAGGREHRGACCTRRRWPSRTAQQFDDARAELGPLARLRDGRAGAAGPRQAHLRRVRADLELRPLGRAADRRVDRQAGQGHPAGGRRAARRRRRPTATTACSPTCATRTSRTRSWTRRSRRSARAGHPTDHARGAAAPPTSAGSSSSPSSPPRWPAGRSASTRSTSRTCRRRRTTPRKVLEEAPADVDPGIARGPARAGAAPPHYIAILGFVDAVRGVRRGGRRAARDAPRATRSARPRSATARATCTPPASTTRAARANGLFIQLYQRGDEDVEIPEAGYSFEHLKNAQALGDMQTLRAHGLPAVRCASKWTGRGRP